MVKGEIDATRPTLVRMQAIDPIQILPGGRTNKLMHQAMRMIRGRGLRRDGHAA